MRAHYGRYHDATLTAQFSVAEIQGAVDEARVRSILLLQGVHGRPQRVVPVLGAANVVLETLALAVPEPVRRKSDADEDADQQRDEDRGERRDVIAEIEHGG